MWVKLTPNELTKVTRRRARGRVLTSIYSAIICALIFAFINREWDVARTGFILVPADQYNQWVPVAILVGILFGLLIFFLGKDKPTMRCTRCGAAKDSNTSSKCECGGKFEDIRDMNMDR
jgi:hypothetical protein